MEFLLNMLRGGLDALQDYILAHALTCLVPTFFIAGTMSVLFPKDKILKYLGENMLRRWATGRMLVEEVI
jgi:uncharacterized membrane protein YraQ (UPF0718 family)